MINQNRAEDLSTIIETYVPIDVLSDFEKQGLITYVKPKNKAQNVYNCVRLADKGKDLLENIQIPEIDESDIVIFKWLAEKYKESDKKLGNQKKTKLYIALFRSHTGIQRNSLAYLCSEFIGDESNFEYNQVLEFMWFKPANTYEKFDVNQSRLYQYYLNRQNYFDNHFKQYE